MERFRSGLIMAVSVKIEKLESETGNIKSDNR